MANRVNNEFAVKPILNYPRNVETGKTYLLTVDLQPLMTHEQWPYSEEEISIYCLLNGNPLFHVEPLGEPTIVIHRFGGTYGPARFLLTATTVEEGTIRITLVNGWGIPLNVLETPVIQHKQNATEVQASESEIGRVEKTVSLPLLIRKQTHFVLWRPGHSEPAPALAIGVAGNQAANPTIEQLRLIPLQPDPAFPELWQVAAEDCSLTDGQVYHYWFKLHLSNPDGNERLIYCTDPTAYTVDRRFLAGEAEPGAAASFAPAGVILYQQGQLIPCDPGGQVVTWDADVALDNLPANDRLVIYKLPTHWTKGASENGVVVGTGTFQDVMALLEPAAAAPSFPKTEELQPGHAHLLELGVNALELQQAADKGNRSNNDPFRGSGTANYFAADYDLGLPVGQTAPTASVDLANLIQLCHQHGVRFFLDAVMAFSRYNPYSDANFLDFYIHDKPVDDPTRDPEQGDRYGFGGSLFRYQSWVEGYHPITGNLSRFVPAREYMKAYISHWIKYYRVDGVRLSSIDNIGSYDFIQEFKDFSRNCWTGRGGQPNKFLVVGEELSLPLALLHQNRIDSLWNEKFKQILRQVILGRSGPDDSFEWSVKKLIDCRLIGFRSGVQAINYVTSHDVGGYGNERLANYLDNNGVTALESRIKLAFVCLLTAVGIPMILAGEEFADQHDLDISNADGDNKQVDPVKFERMNDDWRRRIFHYVARLIELRKRSDALASDNTDFIHTDFSDGKRVLAWQRGYGENTVVVVANFSDYSTPNPQSPDAEYIIHNFPVTPSGRSWREITQSRMVVSEFAGREPVYPWEAKVYELF